MEEFFREELAKRRRVLEAVEGCLPDVIAAGDELARRLGAGHTIFACGNGGCAAQAQHFVGELVGRFKGERRPLPAVALTADSTVLTCVANDFGPDELFARQVEGLMRQDDLLVALSTSGDSENVVKALQRAKRLGRDALALLGRDGGRARSLAGREIVVPLDETALIQEAHLVILHLLCDCIDHHLLGRGGTP